MSASSDAARRAEFYDSTGRLLLDLENSYPEEWQDLLHELSHELLRRADDYQTPRPKPRRIVPSVP